MPLFGPPNIKKMEAKKDVKGLIIALYHEQGKEAAEALGRIGAPAVSLLVREVKYLHRRSRNLPAEDYAIEALATIGAPAVEPLIAVLSDYDRDNYDGRAIAAKALGKIGDKRAVMPLLATLHHYDDATVREAAVEALERLEWEPGHDEAGANYWLTKQNWDECVKIGAPAVEPLIACFQMVGYYKEVAESLVRIGDTRAVEPLIAALNAPDSFYASERNKHAAWALGMLSSLVKIT